jgi:hypothetical protein
MTHNGRTTVVRGSCDGGATVAALAGERRVSKDTIRRAIKMGELPAHRIDGRNGPAWCVHPDGELRPSHDGMHTVVQGSCDGQETADYGDAVPDEAGHLAALVRQLLAENRDLGRQLLDVTAATTMWQERAGVLAERLAATESRLLALTAPQSPPDAPTAMETAGPAQNSEAPARSPRVPATEATPMASGGSWWRRWRAWLAAGLIVSVIGSASCQVSASVKHPGLCTSAHATMDYWSNAFAGRPLPTEFWAPIQSTIAVAEKVC